MMIVVQCNKISKFFKLKKIKLLNKNNNNNNNKSIQGYKIFQLKKILISTTTKETIIMPSTNPIIIYSIKNNTNNNKIQQTKKI